MPVQSRTDEVEAPVFQPSAGAWWIDWFNHAGVITLGLAEVIALPNGQVGPPAEASTIVHGVPPRPADRAAPDLEFR